MFVSPAFLIAAAAGAIVPLILHLMQNRKRDRMPFPTLRFLKAAEQQSSRRIRMENLLLWLIRTMIMIFLGLAFAMPILRSQGIGWLGDAPRDVAIVIDASYSMDYNVGRRTVWKKTIDTARSIIDGLGDNDRFCIYLAREQPEALIAEPVSDREEGISRLKGLDPGSGSSQLAPAVTEAVKALRKDERQREREIFILTDNQALPWQSFGTNAPAGETGTEGEPVASLSWDPEIIDERTTVFAVMLGVPNPENVGPESIELQPALVRRNAAAKVSARLFQSGRASETTATLFVNNEQMGRLPVRLDSTEASDLSFPLPPLPPGVHRGRIETPDDNLPIDNAFHFLIRVEDRLPSLCVGSREDTLFVRTALQAGFGGEAAPPDLVTPDQVSSKRLDDYSCIFLCNALPVSGQDLIALEQFARGGGLLVFFPGTGGELDSYKPWSCLPGMPVSIEETSRTDGSRTLAWDEPAHPLILPLRRGVSVPTLTIRRRLAWDELPAESTRLISMGAEQPFLLERAFGDGRVLMFAVAADRTWSEFPLSPFYLPVILQCVDYSSGFGARSPFLWSTDSLSLSERLPQATRGATLRGPDRKAVPIRSTVVEGRTLLVAEDLTRPGIYELSTPEQPLSTPALAINLLRRESDLTPLPVDDIAARLGLKKVYLATDLETLNALIEEQRIGRTYGELLLWLALVLIVIEFFYANVLFRAGPRLSDQLSVNASGRVKGQMAAEPALAAK